MPDRLLFSLMGLGALCMIALALVWPQGLGARSPGPLGHTPTQQLKKPVAATPKAPPPVLGIAPTVVGPATAPAPARTAP